MTEENCAGHITNEDFYVGCDVPGSLYHMFILTHVLTVYVFKKSLEYSATFTVVMFSYSKSLAHSN